MTLQEYWWMIDSLLGGLLVFLLFVQGGNSLLYSGIARGESDRRMMVNSTGRKWEFTFTTLVTFGGAMFASFPLFYSTSFGGAYWVWMIILFSFVAQAVSYEYQNKLGNIIGAKAYQWALVVNGVIGPFLLGVAVASFFTGSEFIVSKNNILSNGVISQWASPLRGLELLGNMWNLLFGLAVVVLVRIVAMLYFINNIDDENFMHRIKRKLPTRIAVFVILFVSFVVYLMIKSGYAVDSGGEIVMMKYKYLDNLLSLPFVLILFLLGVASVLWGMIKTVMIKMYRGGIWWTGVGVVMTVWALLMLAGFNNTAFYPSNADLQSSLTIYNSSSSHFTLKVMAYASGIIPIVLAYIFFTWRKIDSHRITAKEMESGEHIY